MGDEKKVLLTRPDGTQINVPIGDVEKYKALDYSPETTESLYARSIEAAKEEHFSSAASQALTGAEGLVSGLTVGLVPGFDDEAKERANYNPGTRLGTEIVGGLLPALVSPQTTVGRALGATPAGLLARGAEGIAGATTATKTGHALVKGGVEGAGLGAGAEYANARLNGDPVTAEAILAGMGWGALWGGGIGLVAAKAGVALEKAAATKAASEIPSGGLVAQESWGAFRSAIDDVRRTASTTVDDAATRVAAGEAPDAINARIFAHADELEAAQGSLFNRVDAKGGWPAAGARGLRKEILSVRKGITKAANDGDFAKFEKLTARHAESMKALADLTKVAAPELEPFVMKAAAEGADAIDNIKSLKAVTSSLDGFPMTPEGFAAMTPGKLEKQVAAVDKFIKSAPPELGPQKDALAQAIDALVSGSGLSLDGTPAQKMRGAWEALRSSRTKGASEAADTVRLGGFGNSAVKYVGGRMASKQAGSMGAGSIGRGVAFRAGAELAGGLLSLKSAVLGKIAESVLAWGPTAVKVAEKAAPRVDPLRTRLDGTTDASKQGRKELMASRMREIREAAPTIRDSMYRAVEPLAPHHPELALAMSQAAVAQFDALAAKLPRDPGTAFSHMKTLWHPDAVMMEQFARAYEVFQNPVGVATRWLQNPKSITPEGTRALREFSPELFQHLRVEMLSRLSQPGMMESLKYHEQVGIGLMLDLEIHSTMSPKFIQAQQEMFAERNQPLPMRGQNNSNNPSGTSRGMTPAQRTTDH